jgi:hypothetical protein
MTTRGLPPQPVAALPTGHATGEEPEGRRKRERERASEKKEERGADDGTRTHDLLHGKQTL